MTNNTETKILTAAGKALLAQVNAEETPLTIDKLIFANIPNLSGFPQPEDDVPAEYVVFEKAVEQRGRLSADAVIYSTTLKSDEGPFEFNWTGAYSTEYGVLVTIDHHKLTPKTADEPGVAGNTLVRSVVLEYKDIAEMTNITVDASTWQYDSAKRLKRMDEDRALAIMDMNGKDWFIDDGFLVTPQSSAYNIKAGCGYVSGNRVEMAFDRNLQVTDKPAFIYLDTWREGTPTGAWETKFNFVVDAAELDDWKDPATTPETNHNVCKIARVLADGSVEDCRPRQAVNDFVTSRLVDTPSISFIFDDGTSDHLNVASQFEAHGFRAGFAVNAPQFIERTGRLSRYQLKKLYDSGHEIINHGATHKDISQFVHEPTVVRAEVDTCCDTLNALGIPVFGWVTPYSVAHGDYQYLLSERHAYACTQYGPLNGRIDVRTDPMKLSRFNIDKIALNDFKALIDRVIKNKEHVCIYGHKVTDIHELTPAKLNDMLAYCRAQVDAGQLSVMTTAQQVRMVVGTSNQQFMQIGDVIESGVNGWMASNGNNTTVSQSDPETIAISTTAVDSVIWRILPEQDYLIENQPVTFSAKITASDVSIKLGVHFYDLNGTLIPGKSVETGEMLIDSGKERRYATNALIPAEAAEIRPYLRLPENAEVVVEKPRLKVGRDGSELGRSRADNFELKTRRVKLKLPAQTLPNQGVDTKLLLPDYENDFFKVHSDYYIEAKKNIQLSLNLYCIWVANQSAPNGTGMVLLNNTAANQSRHAVGPITMMGTGLGGTMSQNTTVNLAKGNRLSFDVRHYCDDVIQTLSDNEIQALDLVVL
ncbi:phage tail protein [Photobacterium galatheae]|uniref:Uncharacterized protein n=1 Tax=Photobacterium galatheae TaxID=1654360 RepID=A0A066RKT9_9GAMM|nr:phage tail protein [Photobacterium galatheae]KDM89691.1 hypothetical protein EA58_21020 [Photobacterium galatheae]MCM0151557.1 phage tail protein [Photobacterium galatheae]